MEAQSAETASIPLASIIDNNNPLGGLPRTLRLVYFLDGRLIVQSSDGIHTFRDYAKDEIWDLRLCFGSSGKGGSLREYVITRFIQNSD